jgi:hypothetical protein
MQARASPRLNSPDPELVPQRGELQGGIGQDHQSPPRSAFRQAMGATAKPPPRTDISFDQAIAGAGRARSTPSTDPSPACESTPTCRTGTARSTRACSRPRRRRRPTSSMDLWADRAASAAPTPAAPPTTCSRCVISWATGSCRVSGICKIAASPSSGKVRWRRKFGQVAKVGSTSLKDGLYDWEAEAVRG